MNITDSEEQIKNEDYVSPTYQIDKSVRAIRQVFLNELPKLTVTERRAVLATIGAYLEDRLEALEATLSPIVKPASQPLIVSR